MAHHQHHGADYDAQVSRSLQSRPSSSSMSQMPVISEDDLLADPDEPPEHHHEQVFSKTAMPVYRKQSLLTRALSTTDTESYDETPMPEAYFGHLPSVSSTTSNFSGRSNGDFTSDDGHHSPSTRASTPSSPRSVTNLPKILINSSNRALRHSSPTRHDSDDSQKSRHSSGDATPEPTVEAQLGRKRCITFACGGTKAPAPAKPASPPKDAAAPVKRPCALKFVCPFTASKMAKNESIARRLSPAPVGPKTNSPRGFHRRHRDSDTTIKYESPKSPKLAVTQTTTTTKRPRRASNNSDLARSEACRFHEFASSDEEVEEWTRESTCHMSRLTVTDTLKKENDIRQLAEEADEEDALDDEAAEYDDDGESESDDADDLSDQVSEGGFQTDDEEGFADSDDDEAGSDSDYEWWAPRRSRAASPFIGSDVFRPVTQRDLSGSSSDDDDEVRPTRQRRGRQRTKNLGHEVPAVRPGTPDLPDSTDFVCGTLDEDRPLEQAYMSCIQERKAAKHRTVPQDIDPSFPTSDPEIENDDEEDAADNVDESDQFFMHGGLDNIDQHELPRGRRPSPAPLRSPRPSPKRLRSPAPTKKTTLPRSPAPTKKTPLPRSPAPRALFNISSPRRMASPAPGNKLTSPPPSPKGSRVRGGIAIGLPFLAQRNEYLTHTASLPRSPHPFIRRRMPSAVSNEPCMNNQDDDSGEDTEHAKPYTRGAIDIAQGLEKKRLKRREKFYRQYLKKEEKKKTRRPQPGRGAQRMRQVGLECATIRGKRMLSI